MKKVAPADGANKSQAFNVFIGKQGWLFLDNDTNNSVQQYQGKILLKRAGLRAWKAAGKRLRHMEKAYGLKSAMLIAPSKESVLSEYYPYKKAELRPIEQVLSVLPESSVAYPVDALRTLSDKSYHRNDTHWTQKGAMQAAVELCCSLGLDRRDVEKVFEKDRYKERELAGDLGIKLNPPHKAMTEILATYAFRKHLLFDNGLANMGRMMATEYDQSLLSSSCLIFGASSSYPMLNYLSRIFRRIVFVHSSGNVDERLVQSVGPQYLVVQTNERYVIRPPSSDYDLRKTIREKMDGMDEAAMQKMQELRVHATDETLARVGLYGWDFGREPALGEAAS